MTVEQLETSMPLAEYHEWWALTGIEASERRAAEASKD